MRQSNYSVCPLELSDTYTSVKDFLLDVQAIAQQQGVHVGYRKIKRIFDKWRWDEADGLDRHPQDKLPYADPTGEEAVWRIMRELTCPLETT